MYFNNCIHTSIHNWYMYFNKCTGVLQCPPPAILQSERKSCCTSFAKQNMWNSQVPSAPSNNLITCLYLTKQETMFLPGHDSSLLSTENMRNSEGPYARNIFFLMCEYLIKK